MVRYLYEYGGAMYLPSGQANTGVAPLGVRWFPEANCGGTHVGGQPRQTLYDLGVWVSKGETTAAPDGAVNRLRIPQLEGWHPSTPSVGGRVPAVLHLMARAPGRGKRRGSSARVTPWTP